ncbi:MAG TPA: sugar phosphate nucleotidyltransferase [Candidatus Dormibacteraeota bacterium]|nr:sugar phosphate nucleotidyltransferase [Candidatus Dormibacteraeota bacterium]
MKVLILCGGEGTRAYPYTKHVPKALMPVAGVPILEQVMRIYAAHGFTEFVLALGYMKEEIERYAESRGDAYSIECIDTGRSTDTGGRVRQCLGHLGERFHCTYVDGLGDVDVSALSAFHGAEGSIASLTAAPLRSQYGIVKYDDRDRIVEFVEKPTLPEHWINAGFFVFDREAIADTPGENLERDILPRLAARRLLRIYRHPGFWRSMDTYKDHQELDGLWRPFADDLDVRVPGGPPAVPGWLVERQELARAGIA